MVLSMRAGRLRRLCSTLTRAVSRDGALHCEWSDGSAGRFHHAWLRDHCPQSRHPVSGQRTFELRNLPPQLAPEKISIGEGGRKLALRWAAMDDSVEQHTSAYDAAWLRRACYDGADDAPAAEAAAGGPPAVGSPATPVPWSPADLEGRVTAACTWRELQQPGRAGDAHALACLRELRQRGFVLVSDTPPTEAATAELAGTLGRLQGTFYGDGVWDTAPREEGDVIDTAYSNVELPLHTDGCYLKHQPGLQLFVCAEQAALVAGRELDGATKLADGFAAADILRAHHPATYVYLCRVPIPFHHEEGEVCMEHVAPIFELDPSGSQVASVRYNELDRAPFVPPHLSYEDVADFYEHARILEQVLRSLEMPLRLRVGDALLIDNTRVLHGRHGFVGQRNMIGCYMTSDDWLSRLRVLERAATRETRTGASVCLSPRYVVGGVRP